MPEKAVRLPAWTWVVIVLGGIFGYWAVGQLLLGVRFDADLDTLLHTPGALAAADAETLAPFVLLVIPSVLIALWTRENLRIVLRGLRRGDDPLAIAKELALYGLSVGLLVLAAFFTRGVGRR